MEKVIISKKWNNPEIKMVVSMEDKDTKIEISLKDFLEALRQELGSVAWVFTDIKFQNRLNIAVERVADGIKENTKLIAHHIPME